MDAQNPGRTKRPKPFSPLFLFPIGVVMAYGILLAFRPEQVYEALKSSGTILFNIIPPLAAVFIVMLVLNLFIKPAQVASLLGRGTQIKGIMLSVVAGIISMGPIYVWYPLLKELKEKGAGNLPISVFLYNRAVKPFLLPVMIAYFGWIYVLTLMIMTVLGSIALGYSMSLLVKEES